MSLLNTVSSPEDMLEKLFREGNGIVFENDAQKLSDLVMNFSITANSLRDWCIKYLNVDKTGKQKLVTQWDAVLALKASKDIANSVKHFTITMYTPTVSGTEVTESKMVEFYSLGDALKGLEALKLDLRKIDQYATIRPSFLINFTDGSKLTLFEFYSGCIREWLKFFEENAIPKSEFLKESLIYSNMKVWPQLKIKQSFIAKGK